MSYGSLCLLSVFVLVLAYFETVGQKITPPTQSYPRPLGRGEESMQTVGGGKKGDRGRPSAPLSGQLLKSIGPLRDRLI